MKTNCNEKKVQCKNKTCRQGIIHREPTPKHPKPPQTTSKFKLRLKLKARKAQPTNSSLGCDAEKHIAMQKKNATEKRVGRKIRRVRDVEA